MSSRTAQRVIFQTTDISEVVNDFRASSPAAFAYQAGNSLYVGAEVPFNQLWIQPGAFNAVASVLSASAWYNGDWAPLVDLSDGTAVAGKSLARAGRVQWSLDIDKGWDIEERAAEVGLTGYEIYWMYWLRFQWTATLTASTSLKYLGQKFSRDEDLFGEYPDLANTALMASFAQDKADWDEQAYSAAESIVDDLIARKIILSRGQVFDAARFRTASVHRTASIIYRGMGPAWLPQQKEAMANYGKAMNSDGFRVDRNADGRLDGPDKAATVTYMSR